MDNTTCVLRRSRILGLEGAEYDPLSAVAS
jgi:hypothetical protein